MKHWLSIASAVDRLNGAAGRLAYWSTLLMIGIGAYNAIVRYLDRFSGLGLSTNTYIELQWYLFSLVFLVGAGYTLRHNAHVRVDVFYASRSRRGRAWINLLGTVLFLFPFCVLLLWMSWLKLSDGIWRPGELSPDPGGLPRFPVRLLIPLGAALLLLQGLAVLIRQIAILGGYLHDDDHQRQDPDQLREGL